MFEIWLPAHVVTLVQTHKNSNLKKADETQSLNLKDERADQLLISTFTTANLLLSELRRNHRTLNVTLAKAQSYSEPPHLGVPLSWSLPVFPFL